MGKHTTIILPEPLRSRAKRYAKSRGMSLGELVRVLLAERVAAAGERDPIFAPRTIPGGRRDSSSREPFLGDD